MKYSLITLLSLACVSSITLWAQQPDPDSLRFPTLKDVVREEREKAREKYGTPIARVEPQHYPADTLPEFTQRIQPILLNGCGTGACHGGRRRTQFRLIRPAPGGRMNRTWTRRNMESVISWIDRENPERSPVMIMALQPHGDKRTPPLGSPDSPAYQQLADWIRKFGHSPESTIQAVEYNDQSDRNRLASVPSRAGHRERFAEGAPARHVPIMPADDESNFSQPSGPVGGVGRRSEPEAKTRQPTNRRRRAAPSFTQRILRFFTGQ